MITVIARVDVDVDEPDHSTRLDAAADAVRESRQLGAERVLVCGHRGRPTGPDPRLTLQPAAKALGRILGEAAPVAYTLSEAMACRKPLVVLENIRFDPRERSRVPAERAALARELADSASSLLLDCPATMHRRHASVVDLPRMLPTSLGPAWRSDVAALDAVLAGPTFTLVLGGRKVEDKLAHLPMVLPLVTDVILGGALSLPFVNRGAPADIAAARRVQAMAERSGVRIHAPLDFSGPSPETPLDLGPRSIDAMRAVVAADRPVVWAGPVGWFVDERYAVGTRALAEALQGRADVTIMGGDTQEGLARTAGLETGWSCIAGGTSGLAYLGCRGNEGSAP